MKLNAQQSGDQLIQYLSWDFSWDFSGPVVGKACVFPFKYRQRQTDADTGEEFYVYIDAAYGCLFGNMEDEKVST